MNTEYSQKIKYLEKYVIEQKAKKEQLLELRKATRLGLRELKVKRKQLEQAQVIIQLVAKKTQEQIQVHISDIVTLAMSIFQDPYDVKVEFVEKRGKTELDICFARDGKEIDPLSASGGGVVDVAAFALQVASWCIQAKKSRNVLILDEPLKWLKGDELPQKGAEMIKEISKRIGLQIIMVSHSPELIDSADRVFEVKKKKGVSHVLQVT